MLALATVSIRLCLSGLALSYIKDDYVPILLVASILIAVLGVVTLYRGHQRAMAALDHEQLAVEGSDHPHAHGHDHAGGPRIAWFLTAPLFALLLVAPPPLGAFAANRQATTVVQTTSGFPELPEAVEGAVPLRVSEFSARALYDTEESLDDVTVRLTGFVSDTLPDGFVLTRFSLSCCAADGTAYSVEVRGTDLSPPIDQWVEVVGEWQNRDGHVIGEFSDQPPLLSATSTVEIPQPESPYEG